MVPSLLELCIEAVARSLPLGVSLEPDSLPDEALAIRIFEAYIRLDQARRRLPAYSPARHLAALKQFAALWQPRVLLLPVPNAPAQPGVALCSELSTFAANLAHLELSAPAASWLSGLQGLTCLTCLSLRHCPNLTTAALQQALQQLTQLASLDLSGLAAASDALAPTLASLTNLVVLQLNRTTCSDTTVEWLTYGQRLHQWSATHGRQQAAAPGLGSGWHSGTDQWPRTKIRSWHLAYTRVTPAVVELLSSCEDIMLLDIRGSGVRAAQLAPLRARYALSAVQGAVLSRTAAMVLAAVTWEQFVCADAAQHGAAVAASAVGGAAAAAAVQQVAGCGCSSQQWVNQGATALLQAAAEVAAPPPQHPVPAPFHQPWW